MTATKTRQFVVTVEVPPGVSVEEMEGYIEEAVAVWKGGGAPESPLFGLKGDTVRVARLSRSAVGRVCSFAAGKVREGLANGSLGRHWRGVLHKLSRGTA